MQTYPSWAAQVSSEEGGQWLTHLEAGLEVDGASPEDPVGVDLFLPDEIGTQEIASQVQPLLSTTAGSQGVRAQQLDWSQAQVVILDADQEEATALVVVPEVDSTAGQALLPGGIDFDLDGAVHTAVKVQRVSAGSGARGRWQLTPTPLAELPVIKPVPKPIITAPRLPAPKPAPPSQPPTPAPPVQLGTAIKPVFDYCPYGYSGPVAALSKVLCQNSWELWYRKEWYQGAVKGKVFDAYIQAVTKGAYGVFGARDKSRNFDLLVAGLPWLDQSKLQELWEAAAKAQNKTQGDLDPSLAQFIQTLGDSSSKLDRWMQLLSQAIQQGRLEEEYIRLLVEGLDRLEEAILGLLGSNDRNQAKDLIQQMASRWLSPKPLPPLLRLAQATAQQIRSLQDETRHLLRDLFSIMQVAWVACQLLGPLCPLASQIQSFTELLNTWFEILPCTSPYDCIDAFMSAWDKATILLFDTFGPEAALGLASAIRDLLTRDWSLLASICSVRVITVDCFAKFDSDWNSLWSLMSWMTDTGQSTTESRQRAERGYSTVLIAANSVNQAGDAQGGPWVFLGFHKTTYPYGTWWGAVLAYTPAQLIAPGSTPSKVVAVAGGDHCQDCASKALEIVEWVRKALTVLPSYLSRDPNTGSVIDKGVVTFAFTQSGATGLDAVVTALQASFETSNIPIIVSWRDANGQIWWQCIGSAEACRTARENGYARRAACNQHGQPSSCGAQETASLPSQSAPQQNPGQTSPSEGMGIAPVDPPPLPACPHAACITPSPI